MNQLSQCFSQFKFNEKAKNKQYLLLSFEIFKLKIQ